jgi:NAD(P)-dependent dehydrogenase (short-subunit alcohol dehydrogenase family)
MSYSLDLSGRVALVTGASSGLGAQFARTLASAGAAVVLASRRVEMLKTLRADIEAEGGDAHVVSLDVTSRKSIESAIESAEKEVGPIDILVNNSGVSTTQRLVDVREEDFDFIFNTNVRGAFFVAQAVGTRMLARSKGLELGTFAGGRIINIASVAGMRAVGKGRTAYGTSKGAVIALTRQMAVELAEHGITANAVCPGPVDTPLTQKLHSAQFRQEYAKAIPMERYGSVDEIAATVEFLASTPASYITGIAMPVAGGFLASGARGL